MMSSILAFFDETDMMPHGMCLLWRPDVLWTHVIADAFTALAYFSIPAALIYFAHHRRDFPHAWVLRLFGAFIVWCGITHAVSIWTLWVPAYGVQAAAKAITAAVSVITAIALWPLMPKALRIPNRGELEAKNIQLEREIAHRVAAEMRITDLMATLERRVTERTEELVKAKSEAEKASRAKTIFLASMSHELRSPLNAILGFCQMLGEVYDQGLDERQRGYVGNIRTSGDMLLGLIERLLDLSTLESGGSLFKVEPTDVGECLKRAESILAPLAEKAGVSLNVASSETEPMIAAADPTRLLQIVVNLGSNGIKYNRPGGRVDITALRLNRSELMVRFADTGVGIPAELQPQVFQPFNRLNQERSNVHGSGIGLALSKRLSQAMGADLTFTSTEDKGTVFELTLHLMPLVMTEHAGRRE